MRILQLHCDEIEFEPKEKEIEEAEEWKEGKVRLEDVVTCFIAIEEGDNERVVEAAAKELEESLKELGSKRVLLYPYSHLSDRLDLFLKLFLTKLIPLVKNGIESMRIINLKNRYQSINYSPAVQTNLKIHIC